jgi:hypothetical protein
MPTSWDDPVWSRYQFVARYSTNGLREFAEHALADLRRADASGEDLHVWTLPASNRPARLRPRRHQLTGGPPTYPRGETNP